MSPHLLDVLREARALLLRPDNNFSWSGWDNADEALAELDAYIRVIESGENPRPIGAHVLFLPTGPLQEVSLSSGWGDEFIELAARYDRAIEE